MKPPESLRPGARGRRPLLLLLLLLAAGACVPAGPVATPTPRPPADTAAPREPARAAPLVRLGVMLPQGGSLQPYATAILEGVRLAVAEHERSGAHRVELEVRDASSAAEAAAAARELAGAGVIALIGPLLEENVAVAARARPDPGLLLISPTATQASGQPNAWALNMSDTLGATALGEYAARAGGSTGVLYPNTPDGMAQAAAFRNAFQRAGGSGTPVEVGFAPSTTTYATQVRRLRDARISTVLVTGSDRDVRQVLPQLRYYGLSATVLGAGPWATSEGLQRIGLGELEGAVVAVPFLEDDPASGWQRFRRSYEEMYRRSLPNPMPALGYDAALLVLGALPAGAVDAAGTRRAATRARRVQAATGELVVHATGVARAPLLVRVQDGRLVPLR